MADEEEGNQTIADASHTTDENGCSEVVNDLVIEFECSPQVLEENDDIDNTSVPDELRPLKKAKSSIDESHSCEVNNGSFVSISCFSCVQLYYCLSKHYEALAFVYCNRFKCPAERGRGSRKTANK